MNDDDFRAEYERMRREFEKLSPHDRSSGNWLTKLLHRVLASHAANVDAEYIRKQYPGTGAGVQAKRAITLASRTAGLIGAASAAAVTGLEVSIIGTGGLDAIVAVPAIGSAILADAALTTNTVLRTIIDLAVIRGAPLSLDDHEDCFFILMNALGMKVFESGSGVIKILGPKVVAYNARKLLRKGLRAAVIAALKKIVGTALARKLTEKVAMRVLVPGIGIPISAGMNYAFTRSVLRNADRHLRRRAAVIPELVRFFHFAPSAPRLLPLQMLVCAVEAVQRDAWEEAQLHALRQAQAFLKLTDDDLKALDAWFDRTPADVAGALGELPAEAEHAAGDVLIAIAALGRKGSAGAYAEALAPFATRLGHDIGSSQIDTVRAKLA